MMLDKLKRQINRWRFKHSVKKLRNTEFCIVANNCFGSRFYKILEREYNTPFIGLFIMPECFAKLVANFDTYMEKEIVFINKSKYPPHDEPGRGADQYPLGLLDDVELHFVHYKTAVDAVAKWKRRKTRMDTENLHFILVANGPCDEGVMTQFTGNHPINKVCFHRKEKLKMPACIYIPSEIEDMGNLYSQYQRFVGRFDFADWVLKDTAQNR
jgi:uncharacterized protein (DUF1919 family)